MNKKYQETRITNGSLILSIINKIILKIEDTYDDNYNLFDAKIDYKIKDIDYLLKKLKDNVIDLKINTPWDFKDHIEEINDKKIIIKNDTNLKNYISIKDLYDFIPYIPFHTDLSIINSFTQKTTSSNIEYLFLYDYNGYLSILEGETLKVKIPFIKVAYNMHSHPNGHCGFSLPDINSGLDLLSEGGLASSVVTERCALVMYRQGLVIEDDYINIKSRKYENLKSIKFIKIVY
ncbi:hypothetical protein Calag_1422 [Caldisphaera lagunensis DSM 15908]|uniref:Uncharacterized protein n=1 Tax=Caldisphaera lagunensis (strain DSM 15908 / JCM 11604 / ANMR 0165 / IC-154) TaxID=1056495 RepID=L0ACI9_CALLD|nr:hypothetical protein [Caldisphaera lagunensis]AFZ71129.1 hypothetical protein Calag_1422 [Caldisphaera lagunensis DSM 15908]